VDEPLPRLLKSAERLGLAGRILPLEEGETAVLTRDGAVPQPHGRPDNSGLNGTNLSMAT
jgi:hypothetical protein